MNFTSEAFLNRTPYCRAWDSLPRHIFDTLVDEGFSTRQTDGELLAVACLRVGNPTSPSNLGASKRRSSALWFGAATRTTRISTWSPRTT